MTDLTLVIGNRNYSSWSLRPWILLRHLGLPFREVRLPLDTPEFHREIEHWSPTGKVPVLIDGALRVWESIAIVEYVVEKAGRGWPADRAARAHARSVSAEMHAGFGALREAYPMNIRARDRRVPMTEPLAAAIRRLDALWTDCRNHHAAGGPWLFGEYSAADAMYAPVAFRFQTYGAEGLGALSLAYLRTVLDDPLLRPWVEAAETETERAAGDDVGLA
ncbi:MAG: glutathione S-transferase family protein [Steroidobacteraceae bacterium]|jgi:glutathione S-transferase|nr:glutathione S-transferase family protein [Steroidobacteraceae bacterium]